MRNALGENTLARRYEEAGVDRLFLRPEFPKEGRMSVDFVGQWMERMNEEIISRSQGAARLDSVKTHPTERKAASHPHAHPKEPRQSKIVPSWKTGATWAVDVPCNGGPYSAASEDFDIAHVR